MKKVIVTATIPLQINSVWEVLTDVNNYYKYVKFVKKSKLLGAFEIGSTWTDRTMILFFPMDIKHKIVNIKPKKLILYEIPLPLGGIMTQKFELGELEDSTKIIGTITFDLKNQILNNILGPILEYRLKDMLRATAKNLSA